MAAVAGELSATPATISFGGVTVGSSKSATITLTDTSTTGLSISRFSTKGTGFAVSGPVLPYSLSAGSSTSAVVTFTPPSTGNFSGSLKVTYQIRKRSYTITVTVSGSGQQATTSSTGKVAANPTTLSFGTVQVGHTASSSQTLSNSGTASATISQVATSSSQFSTSGITLPVTLAPGQSYTFQVAFTPTVVGTESGSLSVSSDASNPSVAVALSGTATAPGQLAITPGSFDFGSVLVGTSGTKSATLSASGGSVTVSSGYISDGFALSGLTYPFTIPSGGTKTFSVVFAPSVSSTFSGTFSFGSDATNAATAALSGTGALALPHQVALSWSASSSTDVVGYYVYRASAPAGPFTRINSAPSATTSFTDSSVSAGQTYYYQVTAMNTASVESSPSSAVQAVIPTP